MIGYYKKIGKYKISLLIGSSGAIKPYGDVPKRYHDFIDVDNFIDEEWYKKWGYFCLLPFTFIKDVPKISKTIDIMWLWFEIIIRKDRQ